MPNFSGTDESAAGSELQRQRNQQRNEGQQRRWLESMLEALLPKEDSRSESVGQKNRSAPERT